MDGDFLLALDAKDCADVLGVEHTLHSKKLFLAIDKLRPLNKDEQKKKVTSQEKHMTSAGGYPLRRWPSYWFVGIDQRAASRRPKTTFKISFFSLCGSSHTIVRQVPS